MNSIHDTLFANIVVFIGGPKRGIPTFRALNQTCARAHQICSNTWHRFVFNEPSWYCKFAWRDIFDLAHNIDDQPAMVCPDGQEWAYHGHLHRDGDKPARVLTDGTQEWYFRGELHRGEDKPAIEYYDGTKEWYVHDWLHRDGDNPARIAGGGMREWRKYGHLWRANDQPTIIMPNGTQKWHEPCREPREDAQPRGMCQDDQFHRDTVSPSGEMLPAVVHANGRKEWYVHGTLVRSKPS